MQGFTPMVAAYSAGMSEGHFCSTDFEAPQHTDGKGKDWDGDSNDGGFCL